MRLAPGARLGPYVLRLMGTPPQDKRHLVLPVGHAILVPEVRTTVIREVLDWLDRYLGKL